MCSLACLLSHVENTWANSQKAGHCCHMDHLLYLDTNCVKFKFIYVCLHLISDPDQSVNSNTVYLVDLTLAYIPPL